MSTVRVKLTKTFVDGLPLQTNGKQVFYRDSELIGFALRVTSSKVYVAERRVSDKVVRVKIDVHGVISPAEARERAQQLLAMMAQGINPNELKKEVIAKIKQERVAKAQQPTLKMAYEAYKEDRQLKPRTLEDYDDCTNDYFKDWIDVRLCDISRKMIQDRHSLLTKRSKARANLAMRFMRAIFNFSAEKFLDENDEPMIVGNPVSTLSAKKAWNVVRRRKGHVDGEQIRDWVDGLLKYSSRYEIKNDQYANTSQDFMLLLILTGFRREEGESIRWENLDLKYGTITAVDTKNGEIHTLPMGGELWQVMRDRYARKQDSPFVFPAKRSDLGYIVNRSKARLVVSQTTGIKFTFHDLRRTFGTIAENLDIGQFTIKRLLNHKVDDKDVTSGYIQVSMEKLRIAMSMIENVVLSTSARQALALRAETLCEPKADVCSTNLPSK
jgi:integrase